MEVRNITGDPGGTRSPAPGFCAVTTESGDCGSRRYTPVPRTSSPAPRTSLVASATVRPTTLGTSTPPSHDADPDAMKRRTTSDATRVRRASPVARESIRRATGRVALEAAPAPRAIRDLRAFARGLDLDTCGPVNELHPRVAGVITDCRAKLLIVDTEHQGLAFREQRIRLLVVPQQFIIH